MENDSAFATCLAPHQVCWRSLTDGHVHKGNGSSALSLNCKRMLAKICAFTFSRFLSVSLYFSLLLSLSRSQTEKKTPKCNRAALNQGDKAVGEHFDINHNLWKVGEEFPSEMRVIIWKRKPGRVLALEESIWLPFMPIPFWIILGQTQELPNA